MVIQGKMYHNFGPLQPDAGAQPRFAQVYVLDSAMETEVRVNNHMLPGSVTNNELAIAQALLSQMQSLLKKCICSRLHLSQ